MRRLAVSDLSYSGFGLAVVILLIVTAFAASNLRALSESNHMVRHTLIVLSKLEKTLALITDAETGKRGYIITGEEQYLEPYHLAIAPNGGISQHIQELRQLTSGNPIQQRLLDALERLTAERLALTQQGIDLRRDAGFDAAQEFVVAGQGKQAMDLIRQSIGEMRNEADGLLERHSQAASASLQNTLFVLTAGGLSSLSLLLFSFYIVNREIGERRRAEQALLQLNSELDERVEQRAADLAAAKDQIERQLGRVQSVQAIDKAILSTTDLRLALKTFLEESKRRLEVDVAMVHLFNPRALSLELAAVIGNRHPITEHAALLRLGEGITGNAALERRTITIPNLNDVEPPLSPPALVSAEGIQAIVATPLIARGNLVGAFTASFRSPFKAGQDWLGFFEALAGQAAMAVYSGKSFEDLQRSNLELALAYETTLEGWSRALDLRDQETEGHTLRVTDLTVKLARAAGMTEAELVHVRRGALLHDIGKIGVPDAILLKPDKLTDEEWVVMREHPTYAYELLMPIRYLRPALDIPYRHHEKWDGSGYPRGLKGEQIPLAARLFAVVDVWDALRSDRPYRPAWPDEKVLEHIKSLAGTHFDPKAVEVFFKVMSEDKQGAG